MVKLHGQGQERERERERERAKLSKIDRSAKLGARKSALEEGVSWPSCGLPVESGEDSGARGAESVVGMRDGV